MLQMNNLLANNALAIVGAETPVKRHHTAHTHLGDSTRKTRTRPADMAESVHAKIVVIPSRFVAFSAHVSVALHVRVSGSVQFEDLVRLLADILNVCREGGGFDKSRRGGLGGPRWRGMLTEDHTYR